MSVIAETWCFIRFFSFDAIMLNISLRQGRKKKKDEQNATDNYSRNDA